MQTLTWSFRQVLHPFFKEKVKFAHFQPYWRFLIPVFDKHQGTSENFMGTRKTFVSYLSSYKCARIMCFISFL